MLLSHFYYKLSAFSLHEVLHLEVTLPYTFMFSARNKALTEGAVLGCNLRVIAWIEAFKKMTQTQRPPKSAYPPEKAPLTESCL